MIIRGYAIQFDTIALGDDGLEKVYPFAFDAMLAGKREIVLQYATHDPVPAIAKRSDGTLRLSADKFGLRFEATLDESKCWHYGREITQGGVNRASVQFDLAKMLSGIRVKNGVGTRHICRAEIEHVAIVDDRAAYKDTAVWPAHCSLEHAPGRIKNAAEHWATSPLRTVQGSKATASNKVAIFAAAVSAPLFVPSHGIAVARARVEALKSHLAAAQHCNLFGRVF